MTWYQICIFFTYCTHKKMYLEKIFNFEYRFMQNLLKVLETLWKSFKVSVLVNQYAPLSKKNQKLILIFSITILLYRTLRSCSCGTLSNIIQFFCKMNLAKIVLSLMFEEVLNKSLLMVTDKLTQPGITYSKLITETLEQGVKHIQS